MIFSDYFAEQSCTAGRSSFIACQSVFRTHAKNELRGISGQWPIARARVSRPSPSAARTDPGATPRRSIQTPHRSSKHRQIRYRDEEIRRRLVVLLSTLNFLSLDKSESRRIS